MSKWVVDIHGDIEGDYEIIKKYEEPKADVLDKIRAEIKTMSGDIETIADVLEIINKYKTKSEE